MSYRNPQQVVDTQSGQHIQNMLKQITGATTGAIKTIQANYKQREKENVERVQKLNSAQGKFLNAYNAADIKNSATDWQTGLGKALTRHNELIKLQLDSPLKFTTDNAKELSWLQTIPNQILEDAKQTEAKMQSYNDTMEIPPGDFDGIDKFAPPKLYKTLDVAGQVGDTAGRSIGTMEWDPVLSKGSTLVVSYDGEGNEIGTDANRAFDLPVVPNPTKNIKEVGNGIKETKVNYYKEGVKTRRVSIKDSEGNVTGGYNQEYQEVDMDRLIADVRKKSDSYIIGIGAQPASRLSNNKMLEYIDKIPTMPGMLGVGDLGKIIDPDKATWDMDATGKVIDPYLERTQIAYAKMLIKEEGLGVEKPLRKVYDKTGDEKTTKLTAPQQKLKDQSQFTNKILNEVKEIQAKTGNPSAADSFLSLTNKYIPAGEPKIEQLDDIKKRYIKYMTTVPKTPLSKEEAEAEWQDLNIKTSLAYIKNGEVISLDPSSAESRKSALEDLLITNPKILAKYNLSKVNQEFNQ
jgi:hypothetical protein